LQWQGPEHCREILWRSRKRKQSSQLKASREGGADTGELISSREIHRGRRAEKDKQLTEETKQDLKARQPIKT